MSGDPSELKGRRTELPIERRRADRSYGENRSAAWSESVVWSDTSAVEALQLLQHDETLQVGDVGERSPDGGDVSASLSSDLHAIELGSIAKIDIGVVTDRKSVV